jgi:hypothetical protein
VGQDKARAFLRDGPVVREVNCGCGARSRSLGSYGLEVSHRHLRGAQANSQPVNGTQPPATPSGQSVHAIEQMAAQRHCAADEIWTLLGPSAPVTDIKRTRTDNVMLDFQDPVHSAPSVVESILAQLTSARSAVPAICNTGCLFPPFLLCRPDARLYAAHSRRTCGCLPASHTLSTKAGAYGVATEQLGRTASSLLDLCAAPSGCGGPLRLDHGPVPETFRRPLGMHFSQRAQLLLLPSRRGHLAEPPRQLFRRISSRPSTRSLFRLHEPLPGLSSFDAFILDGQRLVLMQATIAKARRITQQSIRKLLAMLAQEPVRISIVFVVPNAARGISVAKHYLQEGWRVGSMPVLVGYAVGSLGRCSSRPGERFSLPPKRYLSTEG